MKKQGVYFVSLGCPKNRVDTEVMLGHAAGAGLRGRRRRPSDAEVIVVNTCGFIGEAKEESIDTILEMARYKESGRCQRLVVTGCLSQRYPEELADEMPEVDHFLGSGEVEQDRRRHRAATHRARATWPRRRATSTTTSRRAGRRMALHTAYVKIAEGCDRPCALLHHPQAARPAAQPRSPTRGARGRSALVARRRRRGQPGRAGPHHLRHRSARRPGRDAAQPGATSLRRLGAQVDGRCAGCACTTPTRPRSPTSCST